MTIAAWLLEIMKKLGKAEVDSPRRDALVLLEDTLQKDRTWVLAHSDHELSIPTLEKLSTLIERRINREPLAYIRGKAWFYGRFFEVNNHVMIPRPESEDFIDLLKEIRPSNIIDVGTGSGCLAITAALELPATEIKAIDISTKALEVARRNSQNYAVSIEFIQAYLLEPLSTLHTKNTTVIANLPYVPKALITSPEIEQEPAGALFSGESGLDHYQSFWAQVSGLANKPAHILTESLESQHSPLIELAIKSGYKINKTRGLVQHFIQ
jgi:release factor glutamine methyltransferase